MAQSFVFKPNEIEAANFELLFQRFGGFSAFIRKMAQSNGYKSLPSLSEAAKRTARQNEIYTKDFEETIADGIE